MQEGTCARTARTRELTARRGGYRECVKTARYRCTACGNITRFDVTTTRTTRSFHHYTVGGELVVDDVEVQSESVDDVSCRWCGHGKAVEVVEVLEVVEGSGNGSAVPPGDEAPIECESGEDLPR